MLDWNGVNITVNQNYYINYVIYLKNNLLMNRLDVQCVNTF